MNLQILYNAINMISIQFLLFITETIFYHIEEMIVGKFLMSAKKVDPVRQNPLTITPLIVYDSQAVRQNHLTTPSERSLSP